MLYPVVKVPASVPRASGDEPADPVDLGFAVKVFPARAGMNRP